MPDGPVINAEILGALKSAGVADAVADKLLAEYGEERCADNLILYKTPGAPKTTGWLVKAIKDNYSAGKKTAENAKKEAALSAAVAQKAVIEDLATTAAPKLKTDVEERAERETQRQKFDALDQSEKTALIETYLSGLKGTKARDARATLTRPDWLTHGKDEKPFLAWFAKRLDV